MPDLEKVKKIIVNPDQQLSLQLHRKRDEKWIIVGAGKEGGIANINQHDIPITKGSEVYIEKYQTHRVWNKDLKDNLVIIEIQTGVCQEDDIIRLEDDYGRTEE